MTTTLTSKGQLTLPKGVRERLNVQTGDTIEFVVEPDGRIVVRSGRTDVTTLRGLLHKPGRAAVSLEAMDEAIQFARGGHT